MDIMDIRVITDIMDITDIRVIMVITFYTHPLLEGITYGPHCKGIVSTKTQYW
jgi:hypothetical protein